MGRRNESHGRQPARLQNSKVNSGRDLSFFALGNARKFLEDFLKRVVVILLCFSEIKFFVFLRVTFSYLSFSIVLLYYKCCEAPIRLCVSNCRLASFFRPTFTFTNKVRRGSISVFLKLVYS